MDFKKYLDENKYILLDGAMGTMLQSHGLKLGGIPEELNITDPELIKNIHKLYINSGSDFIYTNTFGANSYKLSHSPYSVSQIIKKGIEIGKEAVKETLSETGKKSYIALDIGPIGQLLEPTGILSFEEAYEYYKEQIIAGKDADVIVFETMTDLFELKAAVLAAKENSDLPIICTMTFEENLRTFTGTKISSMAITLEGLGVDAIGVNCSLGPEELLPVVEEIINYTNLPVAVKANAGLPDPITNTYNFTPEKFKKYMLKMADMGVTILGGCCGTDPAFIKELSNALKNYDFSVPKRKTIKMTAVCSATNFVNINEPRIIGERINPTGKKKFKQALLNNDIDYILNQAIEQIEAGAEILDVNVGLPGIDEKEMMIRSIKALQGVVDVPLQIDSTIPEVLEAALRIYNGRPIINSVNGEIALMEKIFPLVKKYGACIVCLALDENGIPKKADERIAVVKKIMDTALKYEIPKENLIIDCLTLTASAEQEGVVETLKAVEMVRNDLGLKNVLGVSNISFGLPNRELVNHTFLTMALQKGLDLPIMNPNIESMTGAFRAFKLLEGYDINSVKYIESYVNTTKSPEKTSNDLADNISLNDKLFNAIEKGMKNEGSKYTEQLLNEDFESMKIVNEILIPALDKIGSGFEKGTIFLPQLIQSAGVAQGCFDVIKKRIKNSEQEIPDNKIVLATVKGDIHDIGKNIVKVLLENYGFTVIDLGKDVEYQSVVDAVKEHNAQIVGLSALMTTTLVSMKETIELIKNNGLKCKIIVGGAVLTPEYAKEIGADYYAKDAKESVDIAKKIFKVQKNN